MNINTSSLKYKIAFHSWGLFFFTLIFFVLAIITPIQFGVRYSILGLLFGEILRIVFSKRKYIIAVSENDTTITITYLNRLLLTKQKAISQFNISITDITETNWWLGRLNKISFENDSEHITFECINKEIKQMVLDKLNVI